ncbi:MAG TPA: TetR/AcrR family transcriptional regulator [Dermatophilaceae bacterium]|nr:TetR/AcrR family transcriptional regulator [Dermatophilaceae bacterium]
MADETLSRKRTETRTRIIQAAFSLFAERGIMASSVEQICDRAGYTRGAFYSNFESKDELCIALLQGEADFYTAAFGRGVAAAAAHFAAHPEDRQLPPYELIRVALRCVLAAFVVDDQSPADVWSQTTLFHLEMGLYAAREPSLRQAYAEQQTGWVAPLDHLLDYVFGLCGLRLTISPAEAANVLAAMFQTAGRNALTSGASQEDVIGAMSERLLLAARCISEPIVG